jgi:branched-chain amino acid transport system ATP-binding protein
VCRGAPTEETSIATPAPLLQVSGVTVRFGGITALDRVSFSLEAGSIVGLIGPNGAGKTTLFNCLSRLYEFSEGEILFKGRSLAETPAHGIAALGMGRTFQNLALFRTLSVRENIMVGGHCRTSSGYLANVLRMPSVRREEATLRAHVERILDLLGLGALAETPVSDLPFGTRKRVELGRALAAQPTLLLLDEPAAGLRAALDLTVLLVEHHMNLVMHVSDQVVALDFGRKIADGTPAQVQSHADVIGAYLGVETA